MHGSHTTNGVQHRGAAKTHDTNSLRRKEGRRRRESESLRRKDSQRRTGGGAQRPNERPRARGRPWALAAEARRQGAGARCPTPALQLGSVCKQACKQACAAACAIALPHAPPMGGSACLNFHLRTGSRHVLHRVVLPARGATASERSAGPAPSSFGAPQRAHSASAKR